MAGGRLQRGIGFIRRQRGPFKVNLAKNIVQNFSLALTQQYQSIYITALGANPLELGYVNGVGGFAGAFVSLPIGALADRHGVRKILVMTMPLMVLGSVVFGLAGSWETTAIALILSTLSMRILFTVCPMICGSTLRNEERATGMQLCDTLSAAPRLVAPVAAAYLITVFGGMNARGIRPLFWLQALGLVVSVLIIHRFFVDPLEGRRGASPSGFIEGVRAVLTGTKMAGRWIAYLTLSSFPMYMIIFVPLFAAEVKGADQFTLGWMDMAFWLVILLLALPLGRLADVFGRKKTILLLVPLYCLSQLLLIHAWSGAALIAAGMMGAFFMLADVTEWAITAEMVPREQLGSWYGVLGLFRGITGMALPVLGGAIWQAFGPECVFYLLIVSQLAKLLILASVPSSITRG